MGDELGKEKAYRLLDEGRYDPAEREFFPLWSTESIQEVRAWFSCRDLGLVANAKALVDSHPENIVIAELYGLVLLRNKRYDWAARELTRAIRLVPSSDVHTLVRLRGLRLRAIAQKTRLDQMDEELMFEDLRHCLRYYGSGHRSDRVRKAFVRLVLQLNRDKASCEILTHLADRLSAEFEQVASVLRSHARTIERLGEV